ncbi:MAG TPA: hypothetical protein VNI58_10585 [Mariprofundaceae bacterium]|nr:hypothetical protein [Mariprofundaceae bacterium]
MMNRRFQKLAMLTMVMVVMGADAALAGGLTARSALPQVIAAGKQWQGDAVLVSLSSISVHADGTADEWKYAFYSPGADKRCVITANGSNVKLMEVRLGYSTKDLGDFIDSDQAMQEAKKHGLKGNEPNMSVNYQGSGPSEATYWIINGGYATGDVSVFLDARTGKFSSSVKME